MPIGGKKYGQKGGGGRGLSLENRLGGGLQVSILVNFGHFLGFLGVFRHFLAWKVIFDWILVDFPSDFGRFLVIFRGQRG